MLTGGGSGMVFRDVCAVIVHTIIVKSLFRVPASVDTPDTQSPEERCFSAKVRGSCAIWRGFIIPSRKDEQCSEPFLAFANE